MSKPRIGILANLDMGDMKMAPGKERAGVFQDYVSSVTLAGGCPLLLPVIQDEKAIQAQMETIEGFMLTGGYDVSPLLYGQEPIFQLSEISPERDEYEIKGVHLAMKRGIPIFAICRGLQEINVALGGTLYQDIHAQVDTNMQHFQQAKGHVAAHTVEVLPKTLLQSIVGKGPLYVNSYHHQAIDELAPGLTINSRSPDGIIEGIESSSKNWLLAVQWHPERMAERHKPMLDLFKAFIKAAQSYQAEAE